MKGRHSDQLFRGLQSPELPDDLPPLALARAHAALRAPGRQPDLWARARSNRALRLAWAASVVGLCVANLFLGGRSLTGPKADSQRALAADRLIEPEIRQIVELPPLKIAASGLSGIRGPNSMLQPETENPS